MKSECTINSRKGDGRIHRTWKATLLESSDDLLVFEGTFEKEITHSELGVIRPGTISVEYYWLTRPFNVFRFMEPSGELRCYYCNVNLPPTLSENVLDYIDLDIDVLWKPGNTPRILDLEEFFSNSARFEYPKEVLTLAQSATQELLDMIRRGDFPFDHI